MQFGIPLIVWGENSAFEYGGREEERTGFRLDGAWLKRHGVTHGTSARDWISPNLSEQELTPYFGPTESELEAAGVSAVFLGYYFEWDPEKTRAWRGAHGFSADSAGPRTGLYDYADIDDDFISIHHWLKWYKFGFTRLFDNLSLEIRNGRMTARAGGRDGEGAWRRHAAKRHRQAVRVPAHHAGAFLDICETFRNHDIWKRDGEAWTIPGFPGAGLALVRRNKAA